MQNKRKTTSFDKSLGYNIRRGRIMRGHSMAEMCGQLDISHQQLQKYEKGTNRITVERLTQIANLLKLPLDFFLIEKPANEMPFETLRTAELINQLPSRSLARDVKNLVLSINETWEDGHCV